MNVKDVILVSEARQALEDGRAQALRQAAKLTQAEVAEVCGVSQASVARWEARERVPRASAALRYARLLARLGLGPAKESA